MDTNVWSRVSNLRRYCFCFSASAAFMSVVVGVLLEYLEESLLCKDSLEPPTERSHLLLIAATLYKVHWGVATIFGVILTVISNSRFGGFGTTLLSSAFYIIGITILVFWDRPPCSERLLFNTVALFCLAIGCGGKELLRTFLSEQLRAKEPAREPTNESRVRDRTRVWYRAAWFIASVASMSVKAGWSLVFTISASIMALSCGVFVCGIRFYHRIEATHRKRDLEETETPTVTIEKTSSFRQVMQQCTSKSIIKIILPTWRFFAIFGVGISTADTFFQWKAGDLKFPFDITALLLLKSISSRGISMLYDNTVLKPVDGESETTRRSRVVVRSWIALWIGMLLMVASLLVGWRVDEAYRHIYQSKPPLLPLWLALQYVLFGSAKNLAADGLSYLLDDYLQNYGACLNGFATGGLGYFLSAILLQIMRRWFLDDDLRLFLFVGSNTCLPKLELFNFMGVL